MTRINAAPPAVVRHAQILRVAARACWPATHPGLLLDDGPVAPEFFAGFCNALQGESHDLCLRQLSDKGRHTRSTAQGTPVACHLTLPLSSCDLLVSKNCKS